MKSGAGEEASAFAVQVITVYHQTAGQPSGRVGKADCGRGIEEEMSDNIEVRTAKHLNKIAQKI